MPSSRSSSQHASAWSFLFNSKTFLTQSRSLIEGLADALRFHGKLNKLEGSLLGMPKACEQAANKLCRIFVQVLVLYTQFTASVYKFLKLGFLNHNQHTGFQFPSTFYPPNKLGFLRSLVLVFTQCPQALCIQINKELY